MSRSGVPTVHEPVATNRCMDHVDCLVIAGSREHTVKMPIHFGTAAAAMVAVVALGVLCGCRRYEERIPAGRLEDGSGPEQVEVSDLRVSINGSPVRHESTRGESPPLHVKSGEKIRIKGEFQGDQQVYTGLVELTDQRGVIANSRTMTIDRRSAGHQSFTMEILAPSRPGLHSLRIRLHSTVILEHPVMTAEDSLPRQGGR